MYKGVLKDDARRREKMKERADALQTSLQKREIYERVQTVSSSESPWHWSTEAWSLLDHSEFFSFLSSHHLIFTVLIANICAEFVLCSTQIFFTISGLFLCVPQIIPSYK